MAKIKFPRPSAGEKWTLSHILPWLLLVGGVIGMLASISLSVEVYNHLKNPAYVPACNLNPILSCTSVADSRQSEVFGFPNYYLGVAGYSVLAAIGAAMLAGAKFKKWFWLSVEAGLLFAIGFIHWLIFETLYRIGALCIFCMVVWAVTIPMFYYTTLYIFDDGYIKTKPRLAHAVAFGRRHHGDILLLWFLIIIGLVAKRFWYYWSTLI